MSKYVLKFLVFVVLFHQSLIFSQTVSKSDSVNNKAAIKKIDIAPVSFTDFCDFILNIPVTSWRTNFSPGSPLYAGVRGALPSASKINFDGINLNDPFTGRFNLHMITPDLISKAENYDHIDIFGNPNTLSLQPLSVPGDQPYTRALYHFNTGVESSFGATFGQPLFTSFRYLSGFSSRTYNNINDGTQNKYQNISFSSHINISKNWNADYTILSSKGDIYLSKSMVVPADTVILNKPHQKNISTNHIVVIKNDSSGLKPEISLHKLSGNFEFKDTDSDNKHVIKDAAYGLSFQAQKSLMHVPFYFGLKYLYQNASVGDTVKITNSNISGYLLTNFTIFPKTKLFVKILPQISGNKKLYFGLWSRYKFNLSNNRLNVAATFSKLFRDPTLSEISGITIYDSAPVSSLFFNLSMLNNHYNINNNIKPESIFTTDLSLNYNKGPGFKSSLSFFNKTTSNIILPELTQTGIQYTNKGKNQFTGIESFARTDILKYFGLISINTIFLKAVSFRLKPANITGNLGVFIKYRFFQGDINGILAASVRYWSSYYIYDWNYGDYLNLITVPNGMIFNIKALFTVMDYAHVTLELTNISSIDPFISSIQYLPERSFRFGLLWELFD
ncbi:TonB-dependent receptor [bacterium]|nr:TonB-dependent receptor [bacterium]